ncbi:protein kinase domain-containing protein [Dictyobacter arantiisoli]|nr:protein kinase [Dictyobacter arantiisoli]
MKCPFCGTVNPAGETFCANCGGYLDSSVNEQTVVGQVSPTTNNPVTSPGQVGNSSSSGGIGTTTNGGGRGTSSTLTPNAQLQNGRYVVEKVLGQGGMGAAVLARDTRVSNKRVVIKELISDESDAQQRQEDVHNFEREVDTLADLDHPLIPTVTDSFQEASRYYMVQEYAPGENLEDHMERTQKSMPELEALTYISQVLDILEYLGTKKPPIVHRDIKPANIIISARDKRARLVDFGIARADEAKHAKRKQTTALGTPGYAPPEQYQGNADARSDLYALAATLHHLVTNRDPRNYPPFNYPPARSINPQVSPELERILERALTIDVTKRYQNAAEMKGAIDALLQNRFHTTSENSSYLLNSAPLRTVPAPPTPPTPPTKPAYNQGYGPVRSTPAPPANPYPINNQAQRPGGRWGNQQQIQQFPPRQQKKEVNYMLWSLLLLIIVIVIIAFLFFSLHAGPTIPPGGGAHPIGNTSQITQKNPSANNNSTSSNSISVTMINGEPIGLSDGHFVFDTSRRNAQYKKEAVAAMQHNNDSQAATYWTDAVNGKSSNGDSGDAEAHIYQEDLRVLNSNSPYLTYVIGTVLSGNNTGTGADNLQGAYVAQHEWNSQHTLGQLQIRLIIANTGSNEANATTVANQIVQAAAKDHSIVGVMGWSFSAHAENASTILTRAKIPMVSATASSDALTNSSTYFFRVAPSNNTEASVAATYAENQLRAKKAVIFMDDSDSYSQSLGNDFQSSFTASTIGGQITQVIPYQRNNKQSILMGLQKLTADPGLIYFAGYANDVDTLLTGLPNQPQLANTQILGGDALYELGGYTQQARPNLYRLHFTAFAYPDEWDVLGHSKQKPAFFQNYIADFSGANTTTVYGYVRPTNNAILSYDAMVALLTASKQAIRGGTSLTATDLQAALTQIKNLQGVSGQITFGADGNPVNKAVVILSFDKGQRIHMENNLGSGTFLAH